jgi:low affinity Fe/Cu permease
MFCKFGELADKVSAHPIFLIVFNLALVIMLELSGIDSANFLISIVTAEMVLLAAGAARRSNKAIHKKLDEIIHSLDNARDELIGLESKSEKDIDKV